MIFIHTSLTVLIIWSQCHCILLFLIVWEVTMVLSHRSWLTSFTEFNNSLSHNTENQFQKLFKKGLWRQEIIMIKDATLCREGNDNWSYLFPLKLKMRKILKYRSFFAITCPYSCIGLTYPFILVKSWMLNILTLYCFLISIFRDEMA